MISHTFTYHKNKVIQALRYHFISRPEIRVMLIVVNVFAIGAAALFFFKKVSPMAFMVSSLLWFVLMLAFWFFLPYSIYRSNKTFHDEFSVGFSSEGFGIATTRGERHFGWGEFSHFVESPHFFHLYFNSRSFFLVPKEALAHGEEDTVRQLIKENIG